MLSFGKMLVAAGIVLIFLGIFLMLAQRFSFLGRLPGDILIKKDHLIFYFPLTTSVLLSILLSLLLFFLSKRTP